MAADLMEAISNLNADLRAAAKLMGRAEVRVLVDRYYQIQKIRTATASGSRSAQDDEPVSVLDWTFDSMKRIERNINRAMGDFAAEYTVGQWLQSLTGVGPIISAGLLCHVDIRKCKTAGALHRFAGLDKNLRWIKEKEAISMVNTVCGTKAKRVSDSELAKLADLAGLRPPVLQARLNFLGLTQTAANVTTALTLIPWNASLKRLMNRAADCFVKCQGKKDDFYGALFTKRKQFEIDNSIKGNHVKQAQESLATVKFGDDKDAKLWYTGSLSPAAVTEFWNTPAERRMGLAKRLAGKAGDGVQMLPPARLQLRAMRWTVKMFLSHVHHVMHVDFYGEEPLVPYAFKMAGSQHTHFIAPPNWPFDSTGKGLPELLTEKDK